MSDENRDEAPEGYLFHTRAGERYITIEIDAGPRCDIYATTETLSDEERDEVVAACWAHADKQRAVGAAQERERIVERLRDNPYDCQRNPGIQCESCVRENVAGEVERADTPPCPGIWHGPGAPGDTECTVCGASNAKPFPPGMKKAMRVTL